MDLVHVIAQNFLQSMLEIHACFINIQFRSYTERDAVKDLGKMSVLSEGLDITDGTSHPEVFC